MKAQSQASDDGEAHLPIDDSVVKRGFLALACDQQTTSREAVLSFLESVHPNAARLQQARRSIASLRVHQVTPAAFRLHVIAFLKPPVDKDYDTIDQKLLLFKVEQALRSAIRDHRLHQIETRQQFKSIRAVQSRRHRDPAASTAQETPESHDTKRMIDVLHSIRVHRGQPEHKRSMLALKNKKAQYAQVIRELSIHAPKQLKQLCHGGDAAEENPLAELQKKMKRMAHQPAYSPVGQFEQQCTPAISSIEDIFRAEPEASRSLLATIQGGSMAFERQPDDSMAELFGIKRNKTLIERKRTCVFDKLVNESLQHCKVNSSRMSFAERGNKAGDDDDHDDDDDDDDDDEDQLRPPATASIQKSVAKSLRIRLPEDDCQTQSQPHANGDDGDMQGNATFHYTAHFSSRLWQTAQPPVSGDTNGMLGVKAVQGKAEHHYVDDSMSEAELLQLAQPVRYKGELIVPAHALLWFQNHGHPELRHGRVPTGKHTFPVSQPNFGPGSLPNGRPLASLNVSKSEQSLPVTMAGMSGAGHSNLCFKDAGAGCLQSSELQSGFLPSIEAIQSQSAKALVTAAEMQLLPIQQRYKLMQLRYAAAHRAVMAQLPLLLDHRQRAIMHKDAPAGWEVESRLDAHLLTLTN